MIIRHIVVWFAAIILAAVSSLAALASVTKQKSPDLSLSLWPDNGFAYANKADDSFEAQMQRSGGRIPEELEGDVEGFALRALEMEPTSASAVRTLAYHRHISGDGGQARELMRHAFSMNRRDPMTNLWLIEDYSRAGDVETTLLLYDATLRSTGEGRGVLLTTMAKALENDLLIEPFYLMLRQEPPWGPAFLRQAAQTAPSLENAAALRVRLAKDNTVIPREIDELLLGALVERGSLALASDVALSVNGPRRDSNSLVRNGDFASGPGLPPFDWRLISSGDAGAGVNAKAGILEISAIGGADEIVAEQLVRLAPGNHELRAGIKTRQGVPLARTTAQLACAEAQRSAPVVTLKLEGSNPRQQFSVGSCRFYWLRIAVDTRGLLDGSELALDDIAIRRI